LPEKSRYAFWAYHDEEIKHWSANQKLFIIFHVSNLETGGLI
jgi:hypothetical protein